MVGKIEHIGIAVNDITKANELYQKLLGVPHYKIEEVESQKVITSFFKTSVNKIELVAPTMPSSTMAKFLEKKGEGIHHIAFSVDDIEKEIKRLKSNGFTLVNETPQQGADNKLVAFVHPKTTHGVLVELCQDIK